MTLSDTHSVSELAMCEWLYLDGGHVHWVFDDVMVVMETKFICIHWAIKWPRMRLCCVHMYKSVHTIMITTHEHLGISSQNAFSIASLSKDHCRTSTGQIEVSVS